MSKSERSSAARLGGRDLITGLITAVVLGITFVPWGRSGQRERTSYEVVDVVVSAGVLPSTYESLAPLWFLVPVTAALVICCGFWIARRTAGVFLTILGASVSGFAHLVDRSPLVATGACRFAVVLGTGAAIWGVGLLVRPQSTGRRQR